MVRRQNDLGKDDIKLLVRRLANPVDAGTVCQCFVQHCGQNVYWKYPAGRRGRFGRSGRMRSDCDPHFSFAFLVGIGGAPLMANSYGRGQPGGRPEDSCQLLCHAVGALRCFDGTGDCISGADADVLWCKRADLPLCKQLSDLLCDGHGVCYPDGRDSTSSSPVRLCQRGDAEPPSSER